MAKSLRVSGVRFSPGTTRDAEAGLVGFVSFLVGDELRVDGATVRRTAEGRLALSYPSKRRRGREFPFVRPISDEARRSIERQVFAELGLDGEGSR